MPSVVTARDWVSPRVKSAEPWTRGRIPVSQEMGRSSSMALPSTRTPSSTMMARMMSLTRPSTHAEMYSPLSGNASEKCSFAILLTSAIFS